ncbi:MAG: transposase [Anaerolineae bacterium]|nr:transposase [Anaerolineae bacterium]
MTTSQLFETLVHQLGPLAPWLDVRHLKTLGWMMVGLMVFGRISLTAWALLITGRACYLQSKVRRLSRWLSNDRVQVHSLYGPVIQQALASWGDHRLYLALDTSLLWEHFCLVRLAVVVRGRAVPLAWRVLEHPSSSVAYDQYRDLLDQAATLLPAGCPVVFLADRGFVDTQLLAHLQRLGWHWRLRLKANISVYRRGQRCRLGRVSLAAGQALFWHHVFITDQRYGPVHLALARLPDSRQTWFIVSDEPTDVTTFDEYGLRFDIEENFLDDKSNGFQLEASYLRSAAALERLCLVLALVTLYLTVQGIEVVRPGKRRWVDPHWFRGSSYLKIGWNWIKLALVQGLDLITHLHLSGEPDPEPAISSRTQFFKQRGPELRVQFVSYAP